MILFNTSSKPATIKPYENQSEIDKYNAEIETKRKEREERKAKEAAEAEEDKKELADLKAEAEEEEKKGHKKLFIKNWIPGFSTFNPLSGVLFTLQKHLRKVCVTLRVTNAIITWQEGHLTFWLTNACVVTGIVLLIVPWDKIIKWTFRIFVWTFLGPWMRLVDIYYVQKQLDKKGNVKSVEERMHDRKEDLMASSQLVQSRREDAKKMKSMRKYLFGKYSIQVPVSKEARYFDVPLPASYAQPHVSLPGHHHKIVARALGQNLDGHMIYQFRYFLHSYRTRYLSIFF